MKFRFSFACALLLLGSAFAQDSAAAAPDALQPPPSATALQDDVQAVAQQDPLRIHQLNEPDQADFDAYGFLPIHKAAWTNDRDEIRKLIDLGGDVNAISNENSRQSVLHVAARYADPDIVEMLLKAGALVSPTNWNGETPLATAMYGQKPENTLRTAQLLLDAGADVNVRIKDGATPLLMACYAKGVKSLDVVKLLVERGANLYVQTNDAAGRTAIHYAARNGLVDIVNYLLDKGVNVDLRNGEGYTPLHLAVIGGQLEAAKVLVSRGADLHAQPMDSYGQTAFHSAAYNGNLEITRYFIEQKVPVDLYSGRGFTALHMASEAGFLDVVKLLVDSGANINGKTANVWQEQPIHRAAYYAQPAIVAYFLDAGADINAKTAPGSTALTLAAEKGDLETVTILVERGADLNLKGAEDMTALGWANKNNKQDVADYLKSKGATE